MNYKTYKVLKTILKFIKTIMILTFVILFLLMLGYFDTHYSREGFITPTKYKNEYLFKDTTDNEWIFFSDEYIEPHTKAQVKMFNNCTTDYIKDDMIVNYTILK